VVTRIYEVRTHGRQMNMHESERIAGLLDEAGFAPVADGVQPGVVFSNRAVRKNADNKLAGNLDHLKRVKHRSPGMQIAVGLRRKFSLAGRDAHDGRGGGDRHGDRRPALLQGHERRRNRIGLHHRIFDIDITDHD